MGPSTEWLTAREPTYSCCFMWCCACTPSFSISDRHSAMVQQLRTQQQAPASLANSRKTVSVRACTSSQYAGTCDSSYHARKRVVPGADLDTACSEEQERDGHEGEHHRDQQHTWHRQVQAACWLLCPGWRHLLPCSQV